MTTSPMHAEDQKLKDAFEQQQIDREDWNQRIHVAIAYIYLRQYEYNEALEHIRKGIKAYNAHHGIEEGPLSGYNETTTVAMVQIVSTIMKAYDKILPVKTATEFCEAHPELMSKHVLRLFYSPERRMHPEAKVSFVEPDLAPLPDMKKD